jgi:hypothetical protein
MIVVAVYDRARSIIHSKSAQNLCAVIGPAYRENRILSDQFVPIVNF